jgi:type I restriction enzyme S subunit
MKEKGYKQTEIGIIPEDWSLKTFKDICWVNQGLQIAIQYRLKNPTKKSKIYITIQFLNDGKEVEYIDDYSQSVCCGLGDVLMTRTGNTGIVVHDIEGVFHNNFFKINYDKSQIVKDYLVYYLKNNNTQNIIMNRAGISTIPDLNHNDFYSIPISLPTLAEQTAIANALSDADAYISSLETLIAKKRLIKQGVMQQLLTPKKGWVEKKLGEVANIQRGASPRPIDSPIWFDENSKVGWVRISDVTKSIKYLIETTQKLTDEGIKNSRWVGSGELIMSICATIGRPIITTFDVCIHDGFVAFYNPIVDRNYLYYYLTFIEKEWSKSGQTGSQMNLNSDIIQSRPFYFPEKKEEQKSIAETLSLLDEEIDLIEHKLSKAKQIKQGMMQELLTGKIRLV